MANQALVVDDSKSIREMVSMTLKESGFQVTEAENGQMAIEKATGKAFDLVVTDINMPVMDGISFIRELRGKPNYGFTPILILTTESQADKKKEGRAAGATGWIVKPFNPEQLLKVVGKVVVG